MENIDNEWTTGFLSSFTSTINSAFTSVALSSESTKVASSDNVDFFCDKLEEIVKSVAPNSKSNVTCLDYEIDSVNDQSFNKTVTNSNPVDCLTVGAVDTWSMKLNALMGHSQSGTKENETETEHHSKAARDILLPTVELDVVSSPFDVEESDFEERVDDQDRDPRRLRLEKHGSRYSSTENTISHAVGDVFNVLGSVIPRTPLSTPPASPQASNLGSSMHNKVAAELDFLIKKRCPPEPQNVGPIDSVVDNAAAGLAGLMDSVVAGNESSLGSYSNKIATVDSAASAAVHALAQVVASNFANQLAEVLPNVEERNKEKQSISRRGIDDMDEEMEEEIAVITPFQRRPPVLKMSDAASSLEVNGMDFSLNLDSVINATLKATSVGFVSTTSEAVQAGSNVENIASDLMCQLSDNLGKLVEPAKVSVTAKSNKKSSRPVSEDTTVVEAQSWLSELNCTLNAAISALKPNQSPISNSNCDVVMELTDNLDNMLAEAQQVLAIHSKKSTPPNAIDCVAKDALSCLSQNLQYEEDSTSVQHSTSRSPTPLLDNLSGFLQTCVDRVLFTAAGQVNNNDREAKSVIMDRITSVQKSSSQNKRKRSTAIATNEDRTTALFKGPVSLKESCQQHDKEDRKGGQKKLRGTPKTASEQKKTSHLDSSNTAAQSQELFRGFEQSLKQLEGIAYEATRHRVGQQDTHTALSGKSRQHTSNKQQQHHHQQQQTFRAGSQQQQQHVRDGAVWRH